jgi:hypothetical protein
MGCYGVARGRLEDFVPLPRCAKPAQQRSTWSRVRATIARELSVSATQLRYLLRQAVTLEQPAPDADAQPLAA